eukprot:UN32070
MVVVATKSGSIKLLDLEQNILHTFNAGHKGLITSTDSLSTTNANLFMTGSIDGQAKVFLLSAWRTSVESKQIGYNFVDHMTLDYIKDNDEVCLDHEKPTVTSVAIHKRRSIMRYLVGYNNGELISFHLDGTVKHRWANETQAESESITNVIVGPKLDTLIITTHGFRLLRTNKLTETGVYCPFQEGVQIIHGAFDTKLANVVYLTTQTGTVYVHRITRKFCKVWKQIDAEENSMVSIESLDGYLFTGSSNMLKAYNITSTGQYKNKPDHIPIKEGDLYSDANTMSLLHKSCSLTGVCILGFLHNN